MKRIAIFVSGAGESAERIVKLFNEGNRLRTVLVVADDSAVNLLSRLKEQDVTLLHIPDEEWVRRKDEVVELLKENDVKLIVLDNFALMIPDEVMEATNGELLRVSSPEQAPREVVAAVEADFRKPVEKVEEVVEEKGNPTLESEWADTLKIHFTPPKIPNTPPEVPENNVEQTDNRQDEKPRTFQPDYNNYYSRRHEREKREESNEPMPSTWLIWSVLVAIFCCFIPGIIAIIFSAQVSSRYYAGDFEGARRASRNAEIWIIVSVVLGILAATLYFPLMLIGW